MNKHLKALIDKSTIISFDIYDTLLFRSCGKFTWVKVPRFLKLLDKCAFYFIRMIQKNEKAISFRSPFSLLYYIQRAKKIANKTDADKIVIENNIPLARVMKRSKFKGQWYYHFHNIPRIDAKCRKEFQKVTKFLCVSQFVADKITNENSAIGQISPDRTAILYNCVDTERFKPIEKNNPKIMELRKIYRFDENDFICIFTGRLSEEKGADKLLCVLKKLPQNVKVLVVGSLFSNTDVMTEFQTKLKNIANQLDNRVVFTGYIDYKEMPFMYSLSNVAVLPSMWEEPAGLTMVEAAACGIPVISTFSGGIPEYLGGGVHKFFLNVTRILHTI